MKKLNWVHNLAPLALAFAIGCSGSNLDAGPILTGDDDVQPGHWLLSGTMVDASLAGSTALALSNTGDVIRATVDENQQFALEVPGGHAYVVHFLQDGQFVAVLYFQKNRLTAQTSSRLVLPVRSSDDTATLTSGLSQPGTHYSALASTGTATDGASQAEEDGHLDLGEIDTEDGVATPENNPNEAIDSDGDGVPNIQDEDADGSGVPDDLEQEEEIDTEPLGDLFIVAHVEPGPGAHRVDRSEKVEIRFNMPVDQSSVNEDTIRIMDASGTIVAGSFDFDRESREVKFEPEADLAEGGEYTIEVRETVTSSSGLSLSRPFRARFQTEYEGEGHNEDAATLRVRKVEPENGEDDVDIDAEIEVAFNMALDPSTATVGVGYFQLFDADGVAIAGTLEVDDDSTELKFTPAALLLPNSEYSIVLGMDLLGRDGQPMTSGLILSFLTGDRSDDDEHQYGRDDDRGDDGNGDQGRLDDDDDGDYDDEDNGHSDGAGGEGSGDQVGDDDHGNGDGGPMDGDAPDDDLDDPDHQAGSGSDDGTGTGSQTGGSDDGAGSGSPRGQ